MRTITGFLFVNMAAADLLVTLIAMPVSMTLPYTEMRWLPGILGNITCKLVSVSLHVSILASILSLMLMSVNRFLGVVFPFARFSSFRRAKVLTITIWLCSMIAMIPAAVLWKIEKGEAGGMHCQPAFRDVFGDYEKGMRVFYTYLFLAGYLIPLLVISVLYGMTCRQLWRQKKDDRQRLSIALEIIERHEARKTTVRTLVIVTAAFAICWLPSQTYHLIFAFNNDLHRSLPRYVMFVCFWFGHANSALNPWLYMLLTNKFLTALREIFLGSYSTAHIRSFRTQSSIAANNTSVRDTSSRRSGRRKKRKSLLEEQQEETPV